VPLWGIIADKRGIRPTLILLVIGSAIMVFSLGHIHSFWVLMFFIPF
jgi:hypothetical protein